MGPLLKANSPWPSIYRLIDNITPELAPTKGSYYQSLIGVLRWIVELGRGDLHMEVSAMDPMMTLPREGHLIVIFNIFSSLKSKYNGFTVFDPTDP